MEATTTPKSYTYQFSYNGYAIYETPSGAFALYGNQGQKIVNTWKEVQRFLGLPVC